MDRVGEREKEVATASKKKKKGGQMPTQRMANCFRQSLMQMQLNIKRLQDADMEDENTIYIILQGGY